MRLIDADKIIKWADDSVSQYGGTYTNDMLNMFGLFKEVISNAPTVEQKYYERVIAQINPVIEARPQGKWEANNYGEHHCNKCGHYALFEEDEDSGAYIERLSQHCPWCGAKMKTPN
jgi:hypothetical protein